MSIFAWRTLLRMLLKISLRAKYEHFCLAMPDPDASNPRSVSRAKSVHMWG